MKTAALSENMSESETLSETLSENLYFSRRRKRKASENCGMLQIMKRKPFSKSKSLSFLAWHDGIYYGWHGSMKKNS